MKKMLALLIGITTFILFLIYWDKVFHLVSVMSFRPQPSLSWLRLATKTIIPIPGSRHFMVSAFEDHRLGGAIRVISIICRQELQLLHCVLCANIEANITTGAKYPTRCTVSQAKVDMHTDDFGFPFVTADVFCTSTTSQKAKYVSVTTEPTTTHGLTVLLIHNQEIKEPFKYNFTICISNLFGEYNNALQFAQTMEVYKLIGVQKVVIYNTSCGPDLEKVLQYYMKQGMLDVVPWPIHKFLTPSTGWSHELHSGDIHYYGQLTTLNECIYRYMYQSKYLLLNDIDEIITPYKYASLEKLMNVLQPQHPKAGVFRIENHIFPKTQFEDSGRFQLARWRSVPGVNILEHIYREPDRKDVFNPAKLLIDPRRVEQTSVHSTLKQFGPVVNVPFDMCRIIHVREPLQGSLSKDQLLVDKKLWEFEKHLIPSIDDALNQSGLL